jgi:hypothetical protein
MAESVKSVAENRFFARKRNRSTRSQPLQIPEYFSMLAEGVLKFCLRINHDYLNIGLSESQKFLKYIRKVLREHSRGGLSVSGISFGIL